MAKGRRQALHQQALLVWTDRLDTLHYLETGSFEVVSQHLPENPLADKIAADIIANGGKLIVDAERFEALAREPN